MDDPFTGIKMQKLNFDAQLQQFKQRKNLHERELKRKMS